MPTFGNSCTDRGAANYNHQTNIDLTNPTSSAGTLTTVCIIFHNYAGGTPTGKVKVFRDDGTNYVFVGESGSQNLVEGTNTFSGLFIPILVGDFIGLITDAVDGGVAMTLSGGNSRYRNGDITSTTLKSTWTSTSFVVSILATYTEITDIYVALTGNDSNSGETLVSAKLTLYNGINTLATSGGNLHIGFGDFSAQTSFQINKTMNWIFDTSGGIGITTFPITV